MSISFGQLQLSLSHDNAGTLNEYMLKMESIYNQAVVLSLIRSSLKPDVEGFNKATEIIHENALSLLSRFHEANEKMNRGFDCYLFEQGPRSPRAGSYEQPQVDLQKDSSDQQGVQSNLDHLDLSQLLSAFRELQKQLLALVARLDNLSKLPGLQS